MAVFSEQISLLIKASAQGAVTEINRLEKSSKGAERSITDLTKSMRAGLATVGVAGLAVGLVKVVTGYADAAKSAGDLAAATGGTVEDVSRMQAALVDAGVSAEASAAMLTKFATAAGTDRGRSALEALNVQLVQGQSGATDYAATMVAAVDSIMAVGDAAQRNTQLVALFGRQGAKAFQDMIASGASLSEVMAAVDSGRIITGEQVTAAQAFDAAADDLNASLGSLAILVGKTLVPALTAGADALEPIAAGAAKVPPKIYLVVAAVFALNKALKSTLVVGLASSAWSAIAAGITVVTTAAYNASGAMATLQATSVAAMNSMRATLVANPLGAVVVALGAAYLANEQFKDSLKGTADEMIRLVDAGKSLDEAMAQAKGLTPDQLDTLKTDPMLGPVVEAQTKAYEERRKELEANNEAMSASARVTQEVKDAEQELTDLIARGVTSGDAFADAVRRSANALAEQDANARLAAQALDLQRAAMDQAYESTLKLLGLDRSERSAERAAEGAADSAADAKANLDKALADAKAAKTVVEQIAGIQGRARQRREEEGIVKGSVDVSAIEGVKGRKAGTRTKVLEAAGFITPAEERQIRAAARQYEEALDDISDAWIRLGQARVAHKEALGIQLTEAEKLAEVRDALKEGLKVPGLSPDAKKDIQADLAEVEKQIKRLGGVPVVIDGIKFKPGTSAEAVKQLQADITAAMKVDPGGAGAALKGQLDAMKEGNGIVDLKVALGLDDESVAATQKSLANIGIDPKTGKPYNAKTVATLDKTKAQAELDALTKDRTIKVTVDLVPGTGGFGGNSPLNPLPQSIPGARGNRINFGAGGGGQTIFAPQVTVNNPAPERASDSIAMALRTSKYLVSA